MVSNPCAQCGADLGSGSVGGLCPRCLVRVVRRVSGEAAPAAGLASPPESQPSRPTRFGDYELLEEVARGGMGVVWRARQAGANRIVALKMILAGRFADAAEVKRFRAEAQAAAQLDHPNIVPIYDVGEEEGQCYFTMKLVEGRSLARAIREGLCFKAHCRAHRSPAALGIARARCCPTAALLIANVARAVHYAHQRGILHRDLTPGNILLDTADEPHVTDFGLAKRLDADARPVSLVSDLTVTGAVLGTPGYLAPEQAAGGAKHLTTAADIYSLGAILYELLTSKPPFQGETTLAILQDVQAREPPRPRSINPHVDPDLETICLKCLEKDPAHRYNSAASLADDLERFLRNEPIRARPSSTIERVAKWTRRNPVKAGVSAAFVAVVLLGAGGVLWEWRAAVAALRQSQESLWQANFDRAQARRTSRTMGQRVETLKAIRAAAAIRPTPELRSEAIAAMALTDLEDVGDWLPVPTNMVSFAADGNGERVAFSLTDGTVEVRRFPDAKVLATVATGQDRPNLRLDDAGWRMLTGDRAGSRVWDLRTTNLLCEVRTPDRPGVDHLYRFFGGIDAALSPDGRRLAYPESDPSVAWREIEAGGGSGQISHTGTVSTLAFSSTGESLAVATEAGTEIWRLPDRTHLATLRLGGYPTVWHQAEPLLAIGCGTEIGVSGFATNETQRLKGEMSDGAMPCWHRNPNLLASTGWDHVLRLWDPFAGVELLETRFARPSRFSTNGQWLIVNSARGVGRLKVHDPQECRLFHLPLGKGPGFGAAFSPDDRFLASVTEGELWTWEVASGKLLAHAPARAGWFDFISENEFVTTGEDGLVLWTNSTPAAGWTPLHPTVIVPPAGGAFQEACFNAAHTQLVVKRNGAGEVYDFPSGRLRFKLMGQRLFSYPGFSPDGRWIASGYFDNNGRHSSEFWIWSAEDGQPARKIPAGNSRALFSPDGRWLILASDKGYTQYAIDGHPTNWVAIRHFPWDYSGFSSAWATFSADGNLLILQAGDRLFRLIETATGRELTRLMFATDLPIFSYNSRWLLAGSGMGVHIWDLTLIRARLREMNLDWDGPPNLPRN